MSASRRLPRLRCRRQRLGVNLMALPDLVEHEDDREDHEAGHELQAPALIDLACDVDHPAKRPRDDREQRGRHADQQDEVAAMVRTALGHDVSSQPRGVRGCCQDAAGLL
jgi:hypothetical protein